mgnify:CR=1 FL=1
MRLLLAEDERALSKALTAILERNNYSVDAVYDGQSALDYLEADNYDGVVLDIMMPKVDGLTVLRKVRERGNLIPILLLTAKSEVDDKVEGLDAGANDYLAKPFHLAELNARVKSLLRRRQANGDMSIVLDNLVLYPDKRTAFVDDVELLLNRKEFDLLYYFASNPNRLMNKTSLAESVWGDNIDQADSLDFIYSQVKNLRKKMKSVGATAEIKAVYGFGYKLVLDS